MAWKWYHNILVTIIVAAVFCFSIYSKEQRSAREKEYCLTYREQHRTAYGNTHKRSLVTDEKKEFAAFCKNLWNTEMNVALIREALEDDFKVASSKVKADLETALAEVNKKGDNIQAIARAAVATEPKNVRETLDTFEKAYKEQLVAMKKLVVKTGRGYELMKSHFGDEGKITKTMSLAEQEAKTNLETASIKYHEFKKQKKNSGGGRRFRI